MASKKDFTSEANKRLLDVIEDAVTPEAQENEPKPKQRKSRRTYDEQEAAEFRDTLRTQGHKGTKAKRINMAFTDSNYSYIETMARVRGETLTGFLNHVIADSMARNAKTYLKALEFRNSIINGSNDL